MNFHALSVPRIAEIMAQIKGARLADADFKAFARFERRVTMAPLGFHVLRFGWEIKPDDCPLIGWNAPRDRARLASNFEMWSKLGERRDAVAVCAREHVLCDVLNAAWLEWLENASQLRAPNAAPDAAMEAARRFLETRAVGAVSLAELAANYRLSPVAFTRRFHPALSRG